MQYLPKKKTVFYNPTLLPKPTLALGPSRSELSWAASEQMGVLPTSARSSVAPLPTETNPFLETIGDRVALGCILRWRGAAGCSLVSDGCLSPPKDYF